MHGLARGCTNARNFSATQPTATAPVSLAMNHSTERTGQPPDVHDFNGEIIDLSFSQNENELVQEPTTVEESMHKMIDWSLYQNENEVVQEPTPVEEMKHESSDDQTSNSDAVKVMAPNFQWPKLSFVFTPI